MSDVSDSYDKVIRNIFSLISSYDNPQKYLLHSRNTLQWVERVNEKFNGSEAEEALKIAALGSDIECVMPNPIKRSHYSDYQLYRNAANNRSAEILVNVMKSHKADIAMTEKVFEIVRGHERGSSCPESIILRDADALSYCDVMVLFDYEVTNDEMEIKKRLLWEYKRMSECFRYLLDDFYHAGNSNLSDLLKKVVVENEIKVDV